MNKLIVANWKMNPESEREAVRLAKANDFAGVIIAPPFVFLEAVGKVLKKAALGAQDVFVASRKARAFTGEISPEMLKNLGVKYVIVGHSERRKSFKETDAEINRKVLAVLKAGLKAILCVGENLSVRKRGAAAAKNFVKNQLRKDLKFPTSYNLKANSLIIAYEPVWAIGTGKNDTPADAAEMIKFIKEFSIFNFQFSIKVLYGGSVDSKNIGGFFKHKEIDGFLVGGASLKTTEFKKIVQATGRDFVSKRRG